MPSLIFIRLYMLLIETRSDRMLIELRHSRSGSSSMCCNSFSLPRQGGFLVGLLGTLGDSYLEPDMPWVRYKNTACFQKDDCSISWYASIDDGLLYCCRWALLTCCSRLLTLQRIFPQWHRCSWGLSRHRESFGWWKLPQSWTEPVRFSWSSDKEGQSLFASKK